MPFSLNVTFCDFYLFRKPAMALTGETMNNPEAKAESKWHQCPRCSFWFDCLTEPSFANRPEEVPQDAEDSTTDSAEKYNFLDRGPDQKKDVSFDTPARNPSLPLGDFITSSEEQSLDTVKSTATMIKQEPPSHFDAEYEKERDQIADYLSGFTMDLPNKFSKEAASTFDEVYAQSKKVDDMETSGNISVETKTEANKKPKIGPRKKKPSNVKKAASIDSDKSDKDRSFPCQKCFNVYKNKKTLDKHVCVSESVKCPVCELWYSDFYQHINNHTARLNFSCPRCCQTYADKYELAGHVCPKNTDPNQGPLLPCSQCNKLCKNEKALDNHLRSSHSEAKFECLKCGEKKRNHADLKLHLEIHEGNFHPCPTCQKMFPAERYLRKHIREVHAERKFKCTLCDYVSKTSTTLKNHMKVNHSNKEARYTFSCPECDQKFNLNARLQRHIKHVHRQEPRPVFQCDQCSKTFNSKQCLMRHIYDRHSGLRPFVCGTCNKTFNCKRSLRHHHASMHSTERPHLCPQCGAGYALKKTLLQHIKSNHMGDLPRFPCEDPSCDKTFYNKNGVKRHMQNVHGEPRCTECNILFATRTEFEVHMMQHAGREAQSCPICHKQFPWKHQLTNHMKANHRDILPEVESYETAGPPAQAAGMLIGPAAVFSDPQMLS